MNSSDIATAGVFAVLLVTVIVIGPLLTIWSLNTLFGLGIAYNVKTWFAAFVLSSIASGRFTAMAKKD